ncbi:sensor histidine kinase [Citreimonas salinaria]|uniref:histidine kinase n=1 Tax=Citreimonas salinaria TaxID=321339 RepID=A0A1H3F9M4_9RHOB|nr:PAS domain-containing protein [Citreimonas salinaria]SDX87595.1 PAS domain S-box-containing protein [Citreimonas salinaria]
MSNEPAETAFLSGGGEIGSLIRANDWTDFPLGPPEGWPQSLRTAVSLMLNSLYPMFIAWGADLAFLYNDAYRPILGTKHPEALGRPFADVWPEIWEDIEPIVQQALAGRATFHENLHLVMERHGYPEDTWYTFSYSPVRDESGGVGGMFCACQETTATVLAERRLASENERLQQLFEQAPGFMALLDGPDHVFRLTNPAYSKLIGHREVEGKPVLGALPELINQGFSELLDEVYTTGKAYTGHAVGLALQHEPGAPEEERFVDFVYQPILDANGQTSGIFVEGHDVTERVRADLRLRLLMNELNHRLKNTLATVQAIIVRTMRSASTLEEAGEALSARVIALSRAQNLLTRENWEGTELATVVREILEPYADPHGSRVSISGPSVPLGPRAALAFALALHELATNAAKHGAFSNECGKVEIEWSVDPGPPAGFRFRWRERGGPPVADPTRSGFGTHLIERGLTAELEADVKLDYAPDGFVFTMSSPLDTLKEQPDLADAPP